MLISLEGQGHRRDQRSRKNFNMGILSDTEPITVIKLGAGVVGGKTFLGIPFQVTSFKVKVTNL